MRKILIVLYALSCIGFRVSPLYSEDLSYKDDPVYKHDLEEMRRKSGLVTMDQSKYLEPEKENAIFAEVKNKELEGDIEGALVEINKIIQNDPDDSLAYSKRGEIKQKLGDEKGSAKDLKIAESKHKQMLKEFEKERKIAKQKEKREKIIRAKALKIPSKTYFQCTYCNGLVYWDRATSLDYYDGKADSVICPHCRSSFNPREGQVQYARYQNQQSIIFAQTMSGVCRDISNDMKERERINYQAQQNALYHSIYQGQDTRGTALNPINVKIQDY